MAGSRGCGCPRPRCPAAATPATSSIRSPGYSRSRAATAPAPRLSALGSGWLREEVKAVGRDQPAQLDHDLRAVAQRYPSHAVVPGAAVDERPQRCVAAKAEQALAAKGLSPDPEQLTERAAAGLVDADHARGVGGRQRVAAAAAQHLSAA